MTWNINIDDEINLWDILTYKRAKIKFKMTCDYYLRKTHQCQPMVNYFGKTSFRDKQLLHLSYFDLQYTCLNYTLLVM